MREFKSATVSVAGKAVVIEGNCGSPRLNARSSNNKLLWLEQSEATGGCTLKDRRQRTCRTLRRAEFALNVGVINTYSLIFASEFTVSTATL